MIQVVANAFISASIYALVGFAFSLRLSSARFFDFSVGLFFTISAYIALFVIRMAGTGLFSACLIGFAGSGFIAVVFEWGLFGWLRRRTTSDLLPLLASLGLYTAGQNMISLGFGDGRESLNPGARSLGMLILGARVTVIQLLTFGLALMAILILYCILKWTRVGLHLQALRVNPSLTEIVGINIDKVVLLAAFFAGLVAGLAGVLYVVDMDMIPSMGLPMLMMAVVVVIVGGQKNILGIAAASLIVALSQHATAWYLTAKWMDTVAFILLLVFLLIRPYGIAGSRPRTTKISI